MPAVLRACHEALEIGWLCASFVWLASIVLSGCSHAPRDEVIVYVSEDRVFSEPILNDFARETGIVVRAVFDTEEAKSTGVMNRLLAERSNPQADVYWANEPIRAEALRQEGVTAPYISPAASDIPAQYKSGDGHWTGFSARVRVLLVRKDLHDKPSSVLHLTEPRFRGQGIIANPLFGTTTAQFAALFSLKGDAWGHGFMAGLKDNQVRLTASNGESADAVVAGAAGFSLVDSDDAVSRIRQGLPVAMVVPDQADGEVGVYLVPNALLIVRGGPHPESARKLVDYLLAPDTERKLAVADCAQLPLHVGVEPPRELPAVTKLKLMPVDYARVAAKMKDMQPWLRAWTGG